MKIPPCHYRCRWFSSGTYRGWLGVLGSPAPARGEPLWEYDGSLGVITGAALLPEPPVPDER